MKDRHAAHGQYAVVTGASSGVGEQFARHPAGAEVPVVPAARPTDRLETSADELARAHGTASDVVVLDPLTESAADESCCQVDDLDTRTVVANAALKNLSGRTHVIPGGANNGVDGVDKYFMLQRLSVRFYVWLFSRALDNGVRSAP